MHIMHIRIVYLSNNFCFVENEHNYLKLTIADFVGKTINIEQKNMYQAKIILLNV